MAERVQELAQEARRTALLATLCEQRGLTLEQLDRLVNRGEHAQQLGELRVGELLAYVQHPDLRSALPRPCPGETPASAVMRTFRMRPDSWMSSGDIVRRLGLRRWTAQKLLAALAEEGQLVRRGVTSGTRYRLASSSAAGAPAHEG